MSSVSIPGKVMLSGEYAVLHGGTAALAHVPRLLHLRAVDGAPAGPYPHVVQAALDVGIPEVAAFERGHSPLALQLDASAFYTKDPEGRRVKLGLGLSAAEAVGTVALRYARAGLEWTEQRGEVARYALEAHSTAQAGAGSGSDVAACASAGAVLCRLREGGLRVRGVVADKPVVPLALCWSGVAADTRRLVSVFERWAGENAPAPDVAAALQELLAASEEIAPAWFEASPAELFALIDRFDAALTACATAAGLPYALPAHTRLAAWAKRHDGRAKPTGAGGGDMILLAGELPLEQLRGLVIVLS
jgi:phosphomevalonate kinase